MFEAITFAIWGKTPAGFNMNTVRNDDSKVCSVEINFDLSGDEIHIIRKFPINSVSELYVNGQLIAENVRGIESWMNERMNFQLVNQLWTNNLVQSQMLQPSFFIDTVLEEKLKDPTAILTEYKKRVYGANRRINSIKLDTTLPNRYDVEAEIAKLEELLKNGIIDKATLSRAQMAQNSYPGTQLMPQDDHELQAIVQNVTSIQRRYGTEQQIRQALEAEQAKEMSRWAAYPDNVISKMLRNSRCKCELCGQEISSETLDELNRAFANGGRSEDKIKTLQEALDITMAWADKIPDIKACLLARQIVRDCPNYEEILKNYNSELEQKWARLKELNNTIIKIAQNEAAAKELSNLKAQVDDWDTKIETLNEYIKSSNNYWTNSILEKASSTLQQVNNRYQQVAIWDNSFYVMVEDESQALNLLPVQRLSNGEKTLVSLSILFAIHELFVPDITLLFDEAFSALDMENLKVVQDMVKNHSGQIFVITHDGSWNSLNEGD